MRLSLPFFVISMLLALCAHGQWDQIHENFNRYRSQALIEKIYIHMDRPYYLAGEMVWFKIYYVDGSFHRPLNISKVVYVELVDGEGTVHQQSKISINTNGNGSGSFKLSTDLKTGDCRVIAYTNWMKNFSEKYFFSQKVSIVNPFIPLQELSKAKSEYGIQFYPEGGHLVNGITSRVAFKWVAKKGTGVGMSGVIFDRQENVVATFTPDKSGFGSFYLNPQKDNAYKAIVKYAGLDSIEYKLPEPLLLGYTMEVKDTTNNNLAVIVKTNLQTLASRFPIYLFVHSRNIVLHAEVQPIMGNSACFILNKDSLGEGTSHFTIFDQMLEPLCERLYFTRIKNKIPYQLRTEKAEFFTRDRINLSIVSAGKSSVSVSVYRVDSIFSEEQADVSSYLNLLSELGGNMEKPNYHLSDSVSLIELDNLMLAHESKRFDWKEIVGEPFIAEFSPEITGPLLKGLVKQKDLGTPLKEVNVFCSVPKIGQFKVAKTDEKGEFVFPLDFIGTEKVIIQTRNENAEIEIENLVLKKRIQMEGEALEFFPNQLNELQMRSIHMQVENAFEIGFNAPAKQPVDDSPFYGSLNKEYKLEDYTRFPTMEEVLREYIPEISVRKNRDQYRIFLRNLETNTSMTGEPLVLLDGTPVFDHTQLMKIDPLQIEKLQVITRPYYFQDIQFDGVVSYFSYKGDLANYPIDSLSIAYTNYIPQREYLQPKHEETTLPDTRHLLFWNPDVTIDATGKANLDFFASDITGTYIIRLNGITKEGLTGSSSLLFRVVPKR
jgi:hypothetical protein